MKTKAMQTFQTYKGLIFCLLCGIFLTCQTNLAKALTFTSQPSWMMFTRCLALMVVLPFIDWEKSRSCTSRDTVYYIFATVCGIMPHALGMLSFMYIGVGDSTAVEFGGGLILTVMTGYVFLGDSVHCLTFLLVIMDFIGVFLVAKPTFIFMSDCESCGINKNIGAVIALSGAVFSSIWPIFIRKLAERDTLCCYSMLVFQGMLGMVLSGLWTSLESAWRIPGTLTEIVMLVLFLTTSTAQYLVAVKSVELEQVRVFAMFITLSVAVSYLLQVTVFGEAVDPISISGAILIMFTVSCSSLSDIMKSKTDDY